MGRGTGEIHERYNLSHAAKKQNRIELALPHSIISAVTCCPSGAPKDTDGDFVINDAAIES